MAEFTATQGRYLAFIQAYINRHGYPPAESEIAAAMCVSPPSVNRMVKTLEKKGLILRQPGTPRSLQMLVPEEEIPSWRGRGVGKTSLKTWQLRRPRPAVPKSPPGNLYVLKVFLLGGPVTDKCANKEISRVIEIRGDQTVDQLHHAIFQAYDPWDQHLYEFQFGRPPFDPKGPNCGIGETKEKRNRGNARKTTLDELKLKPDRVFGYRFDFGDDWFHQIQVERVEQAIPTVTYPRVIKRVGKSPPQYPEE